MELDLVTALTAANITVLQPSHIRQEDKPEGVPYLFVRLFSVEHVENVAIIRMHALSPHFTICHYTSIQFISFIFVQFYHCRQSMQESSS